VDVDGTIDSVLRTPQPLQEGSAHHDLIYAHVAPPLIGGDLPTTTLLESEKVSPSTAKFAKMIPIDLLSRSLALAILPNSDYVKETEIEKEK